MIILHRRRRSYRLSYASAVFLLNAIICFLPHQSIHLIILYNVIRTRAFCSKYAERGIQRFISFDEIGVLCKLRRLRNTRKASERVVITRTHYFSAPRNAYIFFGNLISVIFLSKRLPCHTIIIF